MSIRRIQPGKRLAGAVVHGNVVYLSGQVPDLSAGTDIRSQARSVLGRIDALLAAAGSDKSKLLTATIWLPDIGDFGAMNEVWETWITPETSPARATVESRLAGPDYKIEIQVIAALD